MLPCLTGCGKYEDDTVMEVNSTPVSWDELAYWMGKAQDELRQYYSMFGEEPAWSEPCLLDDSMTCAQWAVGQAKNSAVQVHVLISKAIENDVEITEEDEAEMKAAIAGEIKTYCGEDATEEDFESFIKAGYYTLDYYRQSIRTRYYYNGLLEKLYGKDDTASREKLDEMIGEWFEEAETETVGKYKKFDFTSLFDENGYNYMSFEEFSAK